MYGLGIGALLGLERPRQFYRGAGPGEVQNRNGDEHFLDRRRNYFKMWCGEGDLNPHEIAPASTSS